MDYSILFLTGLFIIALLYASVGHGGASGYLALMALTGISQTLMRPSALLLNLAVSLIAFIQFRRAGHFRWRLIWPLILGSIPAAFLGSLFTVDAVLYNRILGVLLLFPVLRMLGLFHRKEAAPEDPPISLALLTGLIIGFLSGLIGIGGGILLSPLVLLLGWADVKQSAALSAIFIFVNSAAGMAGLLSKGISFPPSIFIWILPALAGGLTGSYFGSRRFNTVVLKRILAVVLAIAAYKLLTEMPKIA